MFIDLPRELEAALIDCSPDVAEAMRLLGLWAAHLTDAGVVSDIAFVPYRPHVGLWGIEDALTAAENTMSADTAVITYQHACLCVSDAQPVLAAANVLAIVAGFHGDVTEGMRWLAAEPKPTTDASLPRPLLQQARTLAAPDDEWAGLSRAPDGAGLVDGPWAQRHEALATYREALRRSPHIDSDAVLRALLTAHLRHSGEAPDGTAWRLAGAIALASTRPRRQPAR